MTLFEDQAARIDDILPWAQLVGRLRGVWRPAEQMIHLRPSGTGIRLVDLHPARPQLDRGKIACDLEAEEAFRRLVDLHGGGSPGRPTPEKRLQSWLIADAYGHQGQMVSLASELTFVTDEQRFPAESKEWVCDILAIHGPAPVIIELKSKRQMKCLVDQVTVWAGLIDAHRDRFARLFGAILGRSVELGRPCEKWIVWPAVEGHAADPQTSYLASKGVRVVSYAECGPDFQFFVGPAVT